MADDGGGHEARPERGAQTRRLILDAALRMFREQSYDRTTMRAIAAAAGVSVGSAYYYFSGKEQLVQAFYEGIQDDHRRRATAVLHGSTDFTERLRGVLHAGVDAMTPYHRVAATFVKVAVDPASPASPFSPQSGEARATAVGLFRDVVEGSRLAVGPQVRAELPELLWLAYLGVTLFWVHDRSPGQTRTRALVDAAAPMIGRLLRLARLPAVRPVVVDLLALVRTLRP
jgi:AcrR family transcriptional regulator